VLPDAVYQIYRAVGGVWAYLEESLPLRLHHARQSIKLG